MRRWAAIVLAGLTLTACGGGDGPRTVSDTLAADPSTQVLATAIREAGLDGPLRGSGPFTVMAPTDAAFSALLTELGITQAQLLADKPLLTAVLQYHVLGARVARADVPLGRAVTPLGGGIFKVDSVSGELRITDGRNRVSRITTTDIDGGNGLIHKVDRVLLPANRNIVQTAQSLPEAMIRFAEARKRKLLPRVKSEQWTVRDYYRYLRLNADLAHDEILTMIQSGLVSQIGTKNRTPVYSFTEKVKELKQS